MADFCKTLSLYKIPWATRANGPGYLNFCPILLWPSLWKQYFGSFEWIFLVVKTTFCSHTILFSPHENKIHIIALPCNPLYTAFSKRFWRVGYFLGGVGWVTPEYREMLWGFFERRRSNMSRRWLSEPTTAWFWEGWYMVNQNEEWKFQNSIIQHAGKYG